MVKTTDDEPETSRGALIPPNLNLMHTEEEIISFDAIGNFKCSRCGWTHTLAECAEYRLVLANRELEKVIKFVKHDIGRGETGESPVDTLLRGFRRLRASWIETRRMAGESTEVTEMLEED